MMSESDVSMQGRHVLVTGGSQGLGLGIVKDLLVRGYKVSSCSRTESESLKAVEQDSHGAFKWFYGDVSDLSSLDGVVQQAVEWGGGSLYGLINNAGMAKEGILATFPTVETQMILQVNLSGAIEMARVASRIMLRQSGGGRIINISSIIGQRGYTGLAAYSASKAGLDGLTRALSREVGRRSITVNSVAPGYLETEMSGTLSDQQRAQIIRRTPLGRLGHVEDVTPLIGFLLSDEARFITGQVLTVDGGISS